MRVSLIIATFADMSKTVDSMHTITALPGRSKAFRRMYVIFASLLAALFGCMFLLMPVCADDVWYLADSCGTPGSWEYFTSTAATCLDHWTYDTGRLANMATAPFLALFPRRIFALASIIALVMILLLGITLSKSPWISGRAAIWILVVSFVLPWFEFLFTVVYASNYIWCAALGLLFFYLFVNDSFTTSSTALIFVGVLTGWWHEGMSVPLLCACLCYVASSGIRVTRRRWLMLGSLLAGILIIACMPAFRAMTGERVSHLVKSVWIETIINVFAYNCCFYIYMLLLLVAFAMRTVRRRLRADKEARAFLLAVAAFGIVATCIYVMYFNGARTGLFSQLMCGIGIMRLTPFLFPASRGGAVAGRCVCLAAMALSLVSVIWAIAVQARLSREHEDVSALAAEARKDGRGEVFYDATPISIGPDFLKPSYMLLNTEYGLRGIVLIPEALKDFTPGSPAADKCSDERLYIYKNHIVAMGRMPEERVDVDITVGDGRVLRSRVRMRRFATTAGDSCTAILPHVMQVDADIEVKDAMLLD